MPSVPDVSRRRLATRSVHAPRHANSTMADRICMSFQVFQVVAEAFKDEWDEFQSPWRHWTRLLTLSLLGCEPYKYLLTDKNEVESGRKVHFIGCPETCLVLYMVAAVQVAGFRDMTNGFCNIELKTIYFVLGLTAYSCDTEDSKNKIETPH